MSRFAQPPVFTLYALNGAQVATPAPIEWELIKSFDSPADSLQAIFPMEQDYGELRSVLVQSGEEKLFSGQLDEQVMTEDDSGKRMRIMARSAGAVLLDNEAKPQRYTNLRLQYLYAVEVRQYGFSLSAKDDPVMQVCEIRKGTSVWEAISGFYRNIAYGFTWLNEYGVLVCSRELPFRNTYTFSNSDRTEGAIRFSSLSAVNNRYLPVSDYLIRDENGAYSSSYVNPKKSALRLNRKRYLNPMPEFSYSSGLGYYEAWIRSYRAMLGKEVVTLVCPGLLSLSVTDRATVDGEYVKYTGRFVHQMRWKVDAQGSSTTLTLLDINYL